MPTLDEMIDEVKSKLIGYSLNQDKVTYVNNTSGITATSTSIQVGASNNFAKGIIEIDDELIWIDSYNKTAGTLNVIPTYGRGYLGTNAAPHSRYALITLSPTFPRINIKQAINDTIQSIGNSLYSISSTTFTFNPSVTTYALPDDADAVLSVSWESVGPSKEWIPVRRWREDKMASASSFNTNITISIYDPVSPGRTVLVWYTTDPNTMDNGSEDFVDVTGLPETSKDVVVLGACYRLLSFIDAGRINVTSAEADLNDSKVPSNAGSSVSRYVYALYQQRLKEEQSRQQTKYPVKLHYNR
jgi:hypothetical protein